MPTSLDPTPHPAEELFTRHHAWLASRLRARLGNAEDAQDLASETFVCVLGQARLDALREPRAFLTTIAKRLVVSLWRRRALERAYAETLARQPEALAPSEEERAVLLETLAHIAHALDGLPLKAQQAFLLSQLDGLTYAAIAARLGISQSTVRRHMAEGFRRIAQALARQQAGIAPMPRRPWRRPIMTRRAVPPHDDTPLDAATEAAIQWLVALNSGAVSASERRAFDDWLAAAAAHREAWQRLSGGLARTLEPARQSAAPQAGQVLGELLARADGQARQRRRLLRGTLAAGGLSALAAFVADRRQPLAQLAADLRTGTGERRSFALADGSTVTLDARSAADVELRPGQPRTVHLRAGALIAQAASTEAAGGTPFVVRTAFGEVRALGTRFMVRLGEDHADAAVLEHAVEIATTQGHRLRLAAGGSARFGGLGIAPLAAAPASALAAWDGGWIEAHDTPLGEVVQALRAYRTGFIRIAPEAAALRVYGRYALDDGDRALRALAETLPIAVRVHRGGWLVTIEAAAPAA